MANLGHVIAKQRYLDNCLIANGWNEVSKDTGHNVYNPKSALPYAKSDIRKLDFKPSDHIILALNRDVALTEEPLFEGSTVAWLSKGDKVTILREA